MLAPRTPPQNGIAERRNRSIIDYVRTLIMEKIVSKKYWREVVSIVVYTLNRLQVKKGTNVIPFELGYGYAPYVKYFKILEVDDIYLKITRIEKLMQNVMKVYS